MDPLTDTIVEAARSILPWLDELLTVGAKEMRRELEGLLARADRGEDVADEILAVLEREPATAQWAQRFRAQRISIGLENRRVAESVREAESGAEGGGVYRGGSVKHPYIPPPTLMIPPYVPTRGAKDPPRSAYGLLSCPDAVLVGQEFELEIGLSREQQMGVAGGKLVRPESSFGPYTMTIKVDADGFDLRKEDLWRNELEVTYEAPYPTVQIHPTARPQSEEMRQTKIEATYSVDGQTIGLAVRYLSVQREETAAPIRKKAPAPVGVDMSIPSAATAPDLTIKIRQWESESGGRLRWDLESPWDIEVAKIKETDIGDDPQRFAEQLVADMNLREGKAGLYKYLLGVANTVADEIPAPVWKAVRSVAKKVAPNPPSILLLSQEPYVPWELAMVDPAIDSQAPPFLAAQAVVGRWVLEENRPPPTPPPDAEIRSMAVVWGSYDKVLGWKRLKEAEEEAKELVARYGAQEVDAVTDAVINCLEGEPRADLVHFAVHGKYDPDGLQHGLALVDGLMLPPMIVKGCKLGDSSPLVFLNACQVGSGEKVLGDYAGMAEAFLFAGASAVVAPLWSVKDTVARVIATSFYERTLERGERPAQVLREERKAFLDSDRKSATYLAYQFFGHPMMQLVGGGRMASEVVGRGR